MASKDPRWIQAMDKEIDILMINNTWDYIDSPRSKSAISSK